MGRKRLTKGCTACSEQHERKEFLRSEWEKDCDAAVRLCRTCDFKAKKHREAEVLMTPMLFPQAMPPTTPMLLMGDLFSPPASLALQQPHQQDDEEDDGEMGHFDEMFALPGDMSYSSMAMTTMAMTAGVMAGNKEQTRSLQAKRRRARLNALFSSLAEELGISAQSDRITILEQTRDRLRGTSSSSTMVTAVANKKQKTLLDEFESQHGQLLLPEVTAMVSMSNIHADEYLNTIAYSDLA
ncbi:hypothetical protein BASA81_001728 [Batrachochytrium salamandrivorans]|nr:hypothetical protein BASA81_001728 [Batrachochytrium salamandrivorans]